MKSLLKESPIHWHNLVENPNDLPSIDTPPMWFTVFIGDDFDPIDTERFTWCISMAVYVPKEKKWYTFIYDVDDSELEDPFTFHPEWKMKMVEPSGKVMMWADPSYDYAMAYSNVHDGYKMTKLEVLPNE